MTPLAPIDVAWRAYQAGRAGPDADALEALYHGAVAQADAELVALESARPRRPRPEPLRGRCSGCVRSGRAAYGSPLAGFCDGCGWSLALLGGPSPSPAPPVAPQGPALGIPDGKPAALLALLAGVLSADAALDDSAVGALPAPLALALEALLCGRIVGEPCDL